MVPRRLLPLLFVALSIGAAACGSGDRPTQVAAGGDPEATTSTSTDAPPTSTTTAPPVATTSPITSSTTAVAPTTTTAPPVLDSDASPVAGLDAAQLQQAVEAPSSSSARSTAGATVDQVTLDDGTRVWRVRVPGDFTTRSARVAVSVGDRVVGQGVLAPDLRSLTAVTTDGAGLTAGRPVSYQWEGGPSIAAGTLAVAR